MRLFKDTTGIRKREKRPHGTLPSESNYNELLNQAGTIASGLSTHPDVVGITLGGGLSRGYGDELSEIDLNVYVREDKLSVWNQGRGPIPQGDHHWDGYHMDVSFLSVEKEENENWSLLKKWDASYVKILYDPENRIEELLDEKDVFTADEKYGIALSNYLDCVYFGDIVVRQWILREDPLVANQMLSRGIPSLVNLVFLANDEYSPFEKWLINYSYSLDWLPVNWRDRLHSITLIQDASIEEVDRRRGEFMELYYDVWVRVMGVEYRKTGLLELAELERLEYVIKYTPTLSEFKEKFGDKHLSYEVLYKLCDIVTLNGEEHIEFNRDRFLREKEMGFPSFLHWNQEMLSHIKFDNTLEHE